MACEEIEQRIAGLRVQRDAAVAILATLQGKAREDQRLRINVIDTQIDVEEQNLTICKAANSTAFFRGYVGVIESNTHDVCRLWFGLTSEAQQAKWIKEANKRVWLTMNMESADRPTHMAQLTLLLEAMRHGLEVEATHRGVSSQVSKEVAGDSYEVSAVRILRSGLSF